MTHQLFLGDPTAVVEAVVGSSLLLDGDEGRHAATVVRLRAGEHYFVVDGKAGNGPAEFVFGILPCDNGDPDCK